MLDNIKKVYYKAHIKNRQRSVKNKMEKEGLTDEILEEQVAINTLKNKHNITVEDEKLYEDYVQ